MVRKSVKLNYIYNVSYQILTLLIPLITTPYISRVLGADGIGVYSYTNSIVTYFTLFSAMGTATYGVREISYLQDDRHKRSQVFWETELLSCISVAVCLVVYFFFIARQNNRIIYLIMAINIISVATDISWLLQGLEEFGKVVFRNIIFKALNIVYIFAFVRTKGDLFVYVFGLSFMTFLSNTSLWIYVLKFVEKPNWRELKPTRNIKEILSLFIPTIAISVYTVLDKTMIGLFTNNPFENGYYEQAYKISRLTLTIVTSLGTVMIPRIGFHYQRKEREIVNEYIYRGYNFVWFLGVLLCFGLFGIAKNFVPWFYGQGYDKVVPLLRIFSFLVLAIGINNVTGMQYLIPTRRQNTFTLTVMMGAGVNIILNLILIPKLFSIGAAIASVAAETVIALVQLYIVRKEFSVWKVFSISKNYLIAGTIMLFVLIFLKVGISSLIINTFITVITGVLVYFLILVTLRDEFFLINTKNVLCKFLQKIKRI